MVMDIPLMNLRHQLLFLACLFAISRRGFAQNADGPVPTPEEEKAMFQVADGFEVNLFASDPLIAKPIQMNFDPAGRLWIATSETYPQIKPGTTANDKVIILEDDGTGKAKAATVFVGFPIGESQSFEGQAHAIDQEHPHVVPTIQDDRLPTPI